MVDVVMVLFEPGLAWHVATILGFLSLLSLSYMYIHCFCFCFLAKLIPLKSSLILQVYLVYNLT